MKATGRDGRELRQKDKMQQHHAEILRVNSCEKPCGSLRTLQQMASA